MTECYECFSEESVYFCCAEQIFLCEKCSVEHFQHLLLGKNLDFSNVIECESAFEQIQVRSKCLAIQSNEYVKEQVRVCESRVKRGKYLGPPTFRINLHVNKEMMNYLAPYYIYVCGIDSQIWKLNLASGLCERPQIYLNEKLKGPFWVLEWDNCLVILGGRKGLGYNKDIFVVNLEESSVEVLAELPEELYSFNPVIHNNILYISGGNSSVPFQKSIPKNEVLRINLLTGDYLSCYYLGYSSYRLKSCIYDDSLLVLSEDFKNTLFYKPLPPHLEFQSTDFELEVTFASDICQFSNILYYFNDDGLFYCEDQNTLKFYQLASFKDKRDLINSGIWNQTHKPCFHDGKIYYISLDNMICVDFNGNVSEINYIF